MDRSSTVRYRKELSCSVPACPEYGAYPDVRPRYRWCYEHSSSYERAYFAECFAAILDATLDYLFHRNEPSARNAEPLRLQRRDSRTRG